MMGVYGPERVLGARIVVASDTCITPPMTSCTARPSTHEAAMAANSLLDRGWGRPRQQVDPEVAPILASREHERGRVLERPLSELPAPP